MNAILFSTLQPTSFGISIVRDIKERLFNIVDVLSETKWIE